MADNSGRLLGTVAAKEAIAKLQAAGLVNNMGIVNLDITDAEIAAAGVEGKSAAAMVKKARYSNIYKLLGDHLNAATYVEIVRNNILVDIQGQDVLYQVRSLPLSPFLCSPSAVSPPLSVSLSLSVCPVVSTNTLSPS
jgi:hypothetical protein